MLFIIITKIIITNKEGRRKLLELIDKFMAQIVVMVSQMYAYLQTRQVVCTKYVQLFVCQSYLNRVFSNKIKYVRR